MPAMTFQLLGAAPSFIHGMVGDKIWQACWKERHPFITEDMFVPYKMMNILKTIIEQRAGSHTEEELLAGKEQYHVAVEAAKRRRANGPGP